MLGTIVVNKSHRITIEILTILLVLSVSITAAAETGENSSVQYDQFMEKAAGRYLTVTEDGTVVLELIPAFGNLFGAVGYYMEGSLYSYYAAELTPACVFIEDVCLTPDSSSSSLDFVIQLYSNMSNAGKYWDGLTQQRLTFLSDDILLSNYTGNGNGLISKKMILLTRNENAPTMFPYNAEMAEGLLEGKRVKSIPDFLINSFSFVQNEGDIDLTQRISFDENGNMTLLFSNAMTPPLLLKGGYAVSENEDGSYELCYLLSSPESGTMPYSGCAQLRNSNGSLLISENDDWNRLLTGPAAQRIYRAME